MTSDRDIERVLDHWFTERPTQVADRVFDDVADRIARQRQRPEWRLQTWRFPTMSTPIKLVAVGAALLVVILGGAVFMGGGSGPVVPVPTATPSPSPSPTASPTPSPSPSPAPRVGNGKVQGDLLRFSFTAPEGWSTSGSAFTNDLDFPGPTGIGVGASGAVNVPDDPCDAIGKISDSRTAEDVVADLKARDDLVVSDAVDTTLGGLSGLRVDVEVTDDFSACAPDNWIIFAEPDGSGYFAQGPSNLLNLWILEAESGPIWVDIEYFAGTPAKDLAEAQALVDSIVFTP
jgi:hypothetical protein